MSRMFFKIFFINVVLFSLADIHSMRVPYGKHSGGYQKRNVNMNQHYQRPRSRERSPGRTVTPNLRADHILPMINKPDRPYLNWLVDGTKKAEGRVNGPACRKMKVGDTILLNDGRRGEYVYGTITFKNEYATFEQMLHAEKVSNMLPFLSDEQVDEGVRIYNSFPGADRVRELGCVAIGITVINFKISQKNS